MYISPDLHALLLIFQLASPVSSKQRSMLISSITTSLGKDISGTTCLMVIFHIISMKMCIMEMFFSLFVQLEEQCKTSAASLTQVEMC